MHNEILLSHKKERNYAICRRDDHTTSHRERQISYGTTYTWNLKYDTDELICKPERDSHT